MTEATVLWRDNRPSDQLGPRYRRRFYSSAIAIFAPLFLLFLLLDAARGFPLPRTVLDVLLLAVVIVLVIVAIPVQESGKPTDLAFPANTLLWKTRDSKIHTASYDDVLMIRTSRFRADWVGSNCGRYIVSLRSRTSWRGIALWLSPENKVRLDQALEEFRRAKTGYREHGKPPAQATVFTQSQGTAVVDGWLDNRPCDRMNPSAWKMIMLVMAGFFVANVSIQLALVAWLFEFDSVGVATFGTLGVGVPLLAVSVLFIAQTRMAVAVRMESDEIVWRTRSGKILRLGFDRFVKFEPSVWKGDWSEGVCQRYVASFRSRFSGSRSWIWLTPLNKDRLDEAIKRARGSR